MSSCKNDSHNWKPQKRETNLKAQAEHGGTTVETAPKSNSWPPIEDIQSEFTAIKDTLTKVKLRADLRLCDSRQGIRRSDQTTHNVQQLFAILLFQIRYLQGEFSALVVQSQFDESTGRIFRSLQKNTSVKNRYSISRGKNSFARKVYKSALQEFHCF